MEPHKRDRSAIFPEIVAGVELVEHPPVDLGHIDFPDTTDDNVGNSAAERQEHQAHAHMNVVHMPFAGVLSSG